MGHISPGTCGWGLGAQFGFLVPSLRPIRRLLSRRRLRSQPCPARARARNLRRLMSQIFLAPRLRCIALFLLPVDFLLVPLVIASLAGSLKQPLPLYLLRCLFRRLAGLCSFAPI